MRFTMFLKIQNGYEKNEPLWPAWFVADGHHCWITRCELPRATQALLEPATVLGGGICIGELPWESKGIEGRSASLRIGQRERRETGLVVWE